MCEDQDNATVPVPCLFMYIRVDDYQVFFGVQEKYVGGGEKNWDWENVIHTTNGRRGNDYVTVRLCWRTKRICVDYVFKSKHSLWANPPIVFFGFFVFWDFSLQAFTSEAFDIFLVNNDKVDVIDWLIALHYLYDINGEKRGGVSSSTHRLTLHDNKRN